MVKSKSTIVLGLIALVLSASMAAFSQQRPRIVTTQSSRPVVQPSVPPATSRPTSAAPEAASQQNRNELVVKTAASKMTSASAAGFKSNYGSAVSSILIRGIQSRWGVPYRRGTVGPDRYDCSGFVWSVFTEAGFNFTRSSARVYWDQFEPVEGEERFKFGTLVFFNKLGHVGIVADEKGFYHASSSKGITYSPFEGYWEKRVVGFRKIPANILPTLDEN